MSWYPCCCPVPPGVCPCLAALPDEKWLTISGVGDLYCDCTDVDGSYLMSLVGEQHPCSYTYQKFMDPLCLASDNNYPPPWHRWRLIIWVTASWSSLSGGLSVNSIWWANIAVRREINYFNPAAEVWWYPVQTQQAQFMWENDGDVAFDCGEERVLDFLTKSGTELCDDWETTTVTVN